MKTKFQKKIGFLAIGLGLALFCFSCATTSPMPQEPAPAPPAGETTVRKETPPPIPKPAPVPSPRTRTVPAIPAPAVQAPPPSAVKEAEPQPAFFLHKVKYSGETLSIIALWYTGKHGNWKEIAQANPDMKPNRIVPGDEILIPEGLLKTRDPLPKEFVDRIGSMTQKERGKPKAQTQPVQAQQEEPKLFGPKKTTPK